MNPNLNSRSFALLFLLACFSCSGKPTNAGSTPIHEGDSTVTLVQSIPLETEAALAQPDLPFAKDVWVEQIRAAKTSIDLSEFYISSAKPEESALEPVFEALGKAGERGVKIRFLVSNDLIDDDRKSFERVKALKNCELRVYDISKLTGGILHNKYMIFDHKTLYVGSQNFDWRSLEHIHETGVLVGDSRLASELGQIFDIDWEIARSGKAPPAPPQASAKPGLEIELVASPAAWNPPGTRPALGALLELIGSAKKSLHIQLLDYNLRSKSKKPWTPIDDALRAAARRGVKIEMIVSNWNTSAPGIDFLKSLQAVPNIEIRIATIPVWTKRFVPYSRVVHSKYLVVDDETLWLGTSNWSEDYFEFSRNVELIFKRPALARKANQIFSKLWSSPYVAWLDRAKKYTPPDISGKKKK